MRQNIQRCLVVAIFLLAAGACSDHRPTEGPPIVDDGEVCGGIQGLPCEQGQFCEQEAGSCSAADLQGVCVDIPEVCTQQYDPVCGCDGETYGNDCERRRAGVQKDHDGECR